VIRGGVTGGVVGLPDLTAPVDSSYARLVSASQFSTLDLETRQLIMRAWANGSPERAGEGMLALVEAGLRDEDVEVARQATRVEMRIQVAATQARLQRQPVELDPHRSPSLVSRILELIDHPDAEVRILGAGLLGNLDTPMAAATEVVLLDRLPRAEPRTKAAIVQTLSPQAQRSAKAREAVLNALRDPSLDVQSAATSAMYRLHLPEGIADLRRIAASAPRPYMRANAVKALESYGPSVASAIPFIRDRLAVEIDTGVRAALEHFLTRMEASK
jgi:HEAT repeat protein